MKKTLLLGMIVAAGCASSNGAKNEEKSGHKEMAADKETTEGGEMGVYVIEREIPGAKDMNWQEIAAKSNGVIKEMNGEVQWSHSYVTDDKVFCVYRSPNPELIKTHADKGGFPANSVEQVHLKVGPQTAEQ